MLTRNQYEIIRLATDSLDQAVSATDMSGRLVFANAAYARLLGYKVDELIGHRPIEILPDFGDVRLRFTQAIETLQAKGAYQGDILMCNRDREPKWVSVTANVVTDPQDQSKYIVATLSDITFAKIHETLQHRLLHDLVQGVKLEEMMDLVCREVQLLLPDMHMSVARIDRDGCLRVQAAPDLPRWYCEAIEGLEIGPVTGSCGTAAWSGEQVNVSDIRSHPLWAPYRELVERLEYRSVWSTPIKSSQGPVRGVFAFYAKSAIEPKPFHWHIVEICGQLCRLVFDQLEARERMEYLAQRDSLTGLHNRAYFQTQLRFALESAEEEASQPFAVHLLDLDRFKEVNDRFGHLEGDRLLKKAADALRRAIADGDTLARLGGDEFALLQANVASRDDADGAARRLVEAIENLHETEGWHSPISTSVGYVICPDDTSDPETLFRNADLALYKSKSIGRGQACSYQPFMTHEIVQKQRLEDDLRHALHSDEEIRIAYQPQFNLANGMLIGFEALARWHHPDLGWVSPETFIPIAEAGGLIGALGERVLMKACRDAGQWPDDLHVAVNLSPMQLQEGDLPLLVHRVLLETGLSPRRLEMEVTENLLIEDKLKALRILRRLSGMGVKLALDDFGTGYASLSYLHTFRFDKIKIDRAFVTNLESNAHSQAIVDAVLAMCHAMGIPVVAEGIETERQMAMLQEKKCAYGQGYLLGRAVEDVQTFFCDQPTRGACGTGGN